MDQIKEDLSQFKKQQINIELVFQGYIEQVQGDEIFVHLTDKTLEYLNHSEPVENLLATLSVEQFPSQIKLQEGMIFYLYLGTTLDKKEHFEIILSRAVWTQEMIAKIHDEAEKMYQFFNS